MYSIIFTTPGITLFSGLTSGAINGQVSEEKVVESFIGFVDAGENDWRLDF